MKRRRLLVVSSSLGEGGAQRVTSTLLARLDRARFEPRLCLFKPVFHFPLPADVPVDVIGEERDAPLADLARRRPWIVGELILRLRRHLREVEPDVVLSNIDQVSCVTGTALVGARRRPLWIARVGSDPAHQGRAQKLWARWAYQRADAVVVGSKGLEEGLSRLYPGLGPKVCRLANPTDFSRIDSLASEAPSRIRDPEVPLLITVSRFTPEKRLDLLLDAVDRVRAGAPLKLWICAGGPLRSETEHQIRARGLEDVVELLGFCENPYPLVRQADLFVLTSDLEGLPNSLIEAQGLGVAAVATDCDYGPREIVSPGETGLLVPTGDAGAFAGAIEKLLTDSARRATFGEAARARTRERYGAARLLRSWEDLLSGECAP